MRLCLVEINSCRILKLISVSGCQLVRTKVQFKLQSVTHTQSPLSTNPTSRPTLSSFDSGESVMILLTQCVSSVVSVDSVSSQCRHSDFEVAVTLYSGLEGSFVDVYVSQHHHFLLKIILKQCVTFYHKIYATID